jgi:phosphotransferase system IIB component
MAKTISILEGVLEQDENYQFVLGEDIVDGYLAELEGLYITVTITSSD